MANGGVDPYDDLAPLTPEEVDFLAAVAKRTFQAFPRHREPILLTSADKGMRREEPRDTLYVASLAFQLPDPRRHSKEVLAVRRKDWSLGPYSVVEFPGDLPSWADLPRIVEDFVRGAKEQDAWPHFVLLNELAHAFKEGDRLRSRWVELAREYKAYIIPGTFNCTTEFVAVAPIYCPDPQRGGWALKQNVARTQEERIRTPDARELLVFETDYGNVVLWICLDMYDPGQVLKFLNITHRFTGKKEEQAKPKREISLVLVPAYSSDSAENIENCVKAISRFSKTAMVCTNSYFEPGDRLESHGFSCGEPLQVVLEKNYPLPGLKGDFCRAKLYGIDIKRLKGCQAANYQAGIFSSTFSAIINGGPSLIREVPD